MIKGRKRQQYIQGAGIFNHLPVGLSDDQTNFNQLQTRFNANVEAPASDLAEVSLIEDKFESIIFEENSNLVLELEVDPVEGTEMSPTNIEDNEKLANRNMNKTETKDAAEILAAFDLPGFNSHRQVDQSQIQIQPKDDYAMSKNITRVVIMTHHRSGSSFTGELFNQHPDVFYMYEPLKIVNGGCSGTTTKLRTELLRNFMHCNFPNLRQMFPNIQKGHEHYTDVKGNFVFRYKVSRLCKPPFCRSDYSFDSKQCMARCPDVQTGRVRAVCVNKIPVIKTLRICDFEILKPFIDEGFNLRIMMLARDPRGIFNSRSKIFTHMTLEERVQNMMWTCRQTKKNMEDLDNYPWLKESVRNRCNVLC